MPLTTSCGCRSFHVYYCTSPWGALMPPTFPAVAGPTMCSSRDDDRDSRTGNQCFPSSIFPFDDKRTEPGIADIDASSLPSFLLTTRNRFQIPGSRNDILSSFLFHFLSVLSGNILFSLSLFSKKIFPLSSL